MNILPRCYPVRCQFSKSSSKSSREHPPVGPASLPFKAVLPYVPKLKQYIVDSFAKSVFNNVDVPFPKLPPPPCMMLLQDDPVPYAIHVPIPVPHNFKVEVKAMVHMDVERGIIILVPPNPPVIWCVQMVVVSKPDGTPRCTIVLLAYMELSDSL